MQILGLFERNGIGCYDLLQSAGIDAVVCLARQYGVGNCRAHALGTALHKHVGGHADRACRIDHVVDDDDVASLDLAYGSHAAHDVGLGALLMRYDDRRAEMLGVGAGALSTAHVGCCDRQIVDVETLHVWDEYSAGIERVDGQVEETLYLVGVQVHSHNAVDACGYEHVGHQACRDRNSRAILAILTRPAEVGYYGDDVVSRGAACGVGHHQKLHQIVRGRECRLDDEHGASADRFVVTGLELAVAELHNIRISELCTVFGSDFLGKVTRAPACKKLDFMDSHIELGYMLMQR